MFLNIGNTFEHRLLGAIKRMNKESTDMVTQLYGCTKELAGLGNARALGRIPSRTMEFLASFIQQAHHMGLTINWTVNAPCLGRIDYYFGRKPSEFFGVLKEMGVDIITAAHPLIMNDAQKAGLAIEVSTVMNIRKLGSLVYLKEQFPKIAKFCSPIYKNRDFDWLKAMSKVCRNLGIAMEPIVNEFCMVGIRACEGIYRESCYCHSAHERRVTNEENYPMALCTAARKKDPRGWLLAPFILPQWLHLYEELGIDHFKVTGRTHPSQFIERVASLYLNREVAGNLLGLWAHLETITGTDEKWEELQSKAVGGVYIDIEGLVRTGFIDAFFMRGAGRDCDMKICGDSCKFCTNMWNQLVNQGVVRIEEE